MAIITSQVTVTTTSQSIISVDNVSRDVLLHAKHDITIGNSAVTTSNGYLMDNGDQVRHIIGFIYPAISVANIFFTPFNLFYSINSR